MAEPVKQEYIPPSYGQLFMDTYLKTHRQRMQTALALAQQELQTQQSLLAYYAKKEKEYLEFIEGVGTAGTSGGSRKGVTDKKFDRKVKLAQLKLSLQKEESDNMMAIEKFVEAEFAVPVGANVNATARQAALNLAADFSNAETAIRGLRGFVPGTPAARVVGVAFYNQMESEASAAGNIGLFNSNKSKIRKAIADQVGSPEVEADILAPDNIQKTKEDRKQKLKDDIIKGAVTDTEIRELERLAGVAPKQTQTVTGAKGPSATALEQEDLMASRLVGIQKKMSQLEDSIMEKSTAEAMLRRQKEIYADQYGRKSGNPRQVRKALRNLTPSQRFLFDSINATRGDSFNPQNYVPAADGSDSASIQFKSYELMNTIIANRGSGKPINVAAMAAKMDPKNAEKIAGLALKGVVTYNKSADPLTKTKEKVDAETTQTALEDAIIQNADEAAIAKEKLELAKATAPIDTSDPLFAQANLPFEQRGTAAFANQQELEDFMAIRAKLPKKTPEEIKTILGMGDAAAGTKRLVEGGSAFPTITASNIAEITAPLTAEEQAQNESVAIRSELKVPVGTILTYKEDGKMGYKFTGLDADGNPQFVFVNKKGQPSPSTTITPDMFSDAKGMYEAALK